MLIDLKLEVLGIILLGCRPLVIELALIKIDFLLVLGELDCLVSGIASLGRL